MTLCGKVEDFLLLSREIAGFCATGSEDKCQGDPKIYRQNFQVSAKVEKTPQFIDNWEKFDLKFSFNTILSLWQESWEIRATGFQSIRSKHPRICFYVIAKVGKIPKFVEIP